MPGTGSTVALALASLLVGGACFAAARASERGPRLVVPRWTAWLLVGLGVASAGRALQAAPSRRHDAAPALDVLSQELRLAALWLVVAITLIGVAASALRRPQIRVTLLAVLVAGCNAAVAGLAVAVVWLGVLVDYLRGP